MTAQELFLDVTKQLKTSMENKTKICLSDIKIGK